MHTQKQQAAVTKQQQQQQPSNAKQCIPTWHLPAPAAAAVAACESVRRRVLQQANGANTNGMCLLAYLACSTSPVVIYLGTASKHAGSKTNNALHLSLTMCSIDSYRSVTFLICWCAGQHMIKVFHAGLRWGISLPAHAVRTRLDLARALNDAFAGEMISAGRGDLLSIIFVDSEARMTELGPTRWTKSKESPAQWKALVDTAIRMYVRGPAEQYQCVAPEVAVIDVD